MADVEIVLHPIPSADSRPYIIVFGPDRQLWFCESGTSKIGRMNPDDGSFVEFATPTPDARPIGITPAADGALWFCENAGNQIGRITTEGAITEFPVRTPAPGRTASWRDPTAICGSRKRISAGSAASRPRAR